MDKCDIAGGQLGCGETCDIRSGYLDCAVAEAAYAEGHSRWGIVWIAVAKVCCRDRVAGAFQNRGSQISGDNRCVVHYIDSERYCRCIRINSAVIGLVLEGGRSIVICCRRERNRAVAIQHHAAVHRVACP